MTQMPDKTLEVPIYDVHFIFKPNYRAQKLIQICTNILHPETCLVHTESDRILAIKATVRPDQT